MFNKGDNVDGYVVDSSVPGGRSQAWIAKKDGLAYFLKVLPSPRYPVENKPTPEHYRKKLVVCTEFEDRNHEMIDRLSRVAVGSGNLVKPADFFRFKNTYVKSYPYIDAASSREISSARYTRDNRVIFLRTLLMCLRELHLNDIVHGDLKPENVLIEPMPAGPVARLIDFDDAYFARRPPPPALAPGSEDYYSPELFRYRQNREDPSALTVAADVFALGIVIHMALLGHPPARIGGRGETSAEVMSTGGRLEFEPLGLGLPDLEATVRATAAPRPGDRPTVDDLLAAAGVVAEAAKATAQPVSRVRSTVGRRTSPGGPR